MGRSIVVTRFLHPAHSRRRRTPPQAASVRMTFVSPPHSEHSRAEPIGFLASVAVVVQQFVSCGQESAPSKATARRPSDQKGPATPDDFSGNHAAFGFAFFLDGRCFLARCRVAYFCFSQTSGTTRPHAAAAFGVNRQLFGCISGGFLPITLAHFRCAHFERRRFHPGEAGVLCLWGLCLPCALLGGGLDRRLVPFDHALSTD